MSKRSGIELIFFLFIRMFVLLLFNVVGELYVTLVTTCQSTPLHLCLIIEVPMVRVNRNTWTVPQLQIRSLCEIPLVS